MRRDEVAKFVRTRRVPPMTKLILLLVFDRAGEQEDGRYAAWPRLATLAEDAGIESVATVRKHLAALEELGIIEREARYEGRGRQTTNRIVLLVEAAPTGAGTPDGGAAPDGAPPPLPPERGTTLKPQEKPQNPTQGADAGIPADFPDELRPHANAAYRVLKSVAEERGARAITARSLATLIMARPRKPIVKAAHDCAAWILDHPEKPCKDVLARYRRWLDGEGDLAAVERLPGEAGPARPANVTSIRDAKAQDRARRRQEADEAKRRIAEQEAQGE